MKTAVLILNIFGLNWLSRFITGHVGTGILVLLIDILTIALLAVGIGWLFFIIGCIIWIVDLVTVCTNKWTHNGVCLDGWSGNNSSQTINVNLNTNESFGNARNVTPIISDTKKCPFCAESIKKEAIVCRYCNRDLPKEEKTENKEIPEIEETSEIENNSENNAEIEQLEKLFDETTNENERGIYAKRLYDLGKTYYWRFIPRGR